MGRLSGKIALVTGGASGIGLTCVERFLAEGARVIATDINPDAQLENDHLLSVKHDVTSEKGWQDTIDIAIQKFGRIDICVNNAGIGARSPKSICDTDLSEWNHVLDVNINGVFLGLKHGMRAMRETGGAIVNMGSVHSFVAIPNASAYCASKGAVLRLTKAAALEGAEMVPQIRVNSVHPGYVNTPLIGARMGQVPELEANIKSKTPMGRLARPEEIASGVLNLVTDDASYVTGSAVTIDGGYTAR